MSDWQAALKQILDEKEKDAASVKVTTSESPERPWGKKSKGRGALPLMRPIPRTYYKIEVEDDGPPIRNWRRSPMER